MFPLVKIQYHHNSLTVKSQHKKHKKMVFLAQKAWPTVQDTVGHEIKTLI